MEADRDSALLDEAEVEALFQQVITCQPCITETVLEEIERSFQEPDGRNRRLGLLLASKGGEWFKEVSENPDTAAVIAESLHYVDHHIRRLRQVADLMEHGHTRAMIALCNHAEFDPVACEMRKPGHA